MVSRPWYGALFTAAVVVSEQARGFGGGEADHLVQQQGRPLPGGQVLEWFSGRRP